MVERNGAPNFRTALLTLQRCQGAYALLRGNALGQQFVRRQRPAITGDKRSAASDLAAADAREAASRVSRYCLRLVDRTLPLMRPGFGSVAVSSLAAKRIKAANDLVTGAEQGLG